MLIRELDSIVAKAEGKRHQASIGDVREIRRILFHVLTSIEGVEGPIAMYDLIRRGAGRKAVK
jgi:hypothetical protein